MFSILLVEDNPADVLLIRSMLEKPDAAFELVSAETLRLALQRVAQGGIDIALLDLGLPDSQGIETVAAFRRGAPHIPVLVLTGSDSEAVALDAVQAGAQDCLPKSRLAGQWLWRVIRYAIERMALEEQLRASQSLQAIGQLAGGVAHDFNNLLTVINGRAELALEQLPAAAPVRPHLEAILKTGQRAATLTQQLLAFSRKQTLRPEVLDLNAVVRGVESLLRETLPETIVFKTAVSPELGPVFADRGQLEQVLVNLVLNARDAMPAGGTLTIQTHNESSLGSAPGTRVLRKHRVDSGILNVSTLAPYVMFTVRDTGCGMDANTLSHIFEPFFTTKPKGKGTGLGLATVYGIVRQSGGHIQVDSEPGKGTSVRVYLPRAKGGVASASISNKMPAVTGGETILLAEDDDAVRDLLRTVLQQLGYAVLPCANGRVALDTARSHQGNIHLLLTDVVMPEMNGPDLAAAMKVERPDTRVVFMSGYTGDGESERQVMDSGAPFIKKPFKARELANIIRQALAGA